MKSRAIKPVMRGGRGKGSGTADTKRQARATLPRKPRATRKPSGDPMVKTMGALAPDLAQTLFDHWPECNAQRLRDGGYAMLRGVVAEVVYSELAYARGMYHAPVELGAERGMVEGCAAVRERVRELPLTDVTPDHFGCVHESLAGYHLADGKIVKNDGRRRNGVHYTPPELAMKVTTRTVEPLLECIGEQSPLVLRIADPAVGAGAFPLALVRMLGPLVLERGEAPNLDAAKRLVAMHCCYGVDKSRYAVHSCKLALRLECRADGMPRTWLDDNIKHGDALVGLNSKQFKEFDWKEGRSAGRELLGPLWDAAIKQAAHERIARLDALSQQARAS